MTSRTIKKHLVEKLQTLSLNQLYQEVNNYPEQAVFHTLFSCLLHKNEQVRNKSILLFGRVLAMLAEKDMERARIIMRRCIWMLNDESGGIGWGIPEAMGESIACHKGLATEYCHILVSFMRKDGLFLELEQLQRGLMWAIGRVAEVRKELLRSLNATQLITPYLKSNDIVVKKMAATALKNLS